MWGPYKDVSLSYVFLQRFLKASVTKVICETKPEMKLLSNVMDFRNVPVVLGVTAVISLSLNGK